MRLREYLNEITPSVDLYLDEVNDLIYKNCKPYLKLIGNFYPLYRGIYSLTPKYLNSGFDKKKVRKNREPQATDQKVFKMLNIWLQKNGHNRRDQSISVTSNISTASTFGDAAMVFPIGKFSYSWIKAEDLNILDIVTGWDKWKELYKTKLELSKWIFTDKKFKVPYMKRYEIWINCKEYYYVSTDNYLWNGITKKLEQRNK